jgi:hypothetical protein
MQVPITEKRTIWVGSSRNGQGGRDAVKHDMKSAAWKRERQEGKKESSQYDRETGQRCVTYLVRTSMMPNLEGASKLVLQLICAKLDFVRATTLSWQRMAYRKSVNIPTACHKILARTAHIHHLYSYLVQTSSTNFTDVPWLKKH